VNAKNVDFALLVRKTFDVMYESMIGLARINLMTQAELDAMAKAVKE
jgi:hypothetical protein